MKKVIVAGAGHGGLVAAIHLAKAGWDAAVYEADKRENLGYEWPDTVSKALFARAGLDPMPEGTMTPFYKMRYFAPNMETSISDDEANGNVAFIERKPLIEYLLKTAEDAGVKLFFETPVKEAVGEDAAVRGIILQNGETVTADLVIDAAGVDSPVRQTLPSACWIQKEIPYEDRIVIWRAIFNKTEPELTDPPYNVYFYHCGKPGMDWMITEEDTADILIGGFGELTQEHIDEALADFRAHYPYVGETILRGGKGINTIPLRKTLPLIVADGYAAVGDSACMTEPLSGSGITLSMEAGFLLARTILEAGGKTDVATLWTYQYIYFKALGNGYLMNDIARKILASVDADDVDSLLMKDILTMKEISGRSDYTPKDIYLKVKGVLSMPHIFPALRTAGLRLAKMKAVCDAMPRRFDRDAVADWIVKYESL